jgi:hypothetical protein
MFSSWRPRSRNDLFTKSFQKLVFLAVIVSCTACAQTGVRPVAQTAEKSLPLPMRILIFGVTADESEVAEYQGIMRQQPANAIRSSAGAKSPRTFHRLLPSSSYRDCANSALGWSESSAP